MSRRCGWGRRVGRIGCRRRLSLMFVRQPSLDVLHERLDGLDLHCRESG